MKQEGLDLRKKKTRSSIQNAFLQLRAKKEVERITVKELSEIAQISKATFYLHYQDIYDLSEQMQEEVIGQILKEVVHPQEALFPDMEQTAHRLAESFFVHQNLIDILFSGSQSSLLPLRLEEGIRQQVFKVKPQAQKDLTFCVLLSYEVQGSYYAYQKNHREFGEEGVLKALDEISALLKKTVKKENKEGGD